MQVRISDVERDSVFGMPRNTYKAEQFDIGGLNERQQSCLEARYVDDLPTLVTDLPGRTGRTQVVPNPARVPATPAVARDAKVANALVFISGKVIRLDSDMPLVNSFTPWSGNEIRTEAVMGPEVEIELTLSSIMGGHTVYVPPGVRVIDQNINVMVRVSITEETDGDDSNGILIIKGFNFRDGTSVTLRNPGK